MQDMVQLCQPEETRAEISLEAGKVSHICSGHNLAMHSLQSTMPPFYP